MKASTVLPKRQHKKCDRIHARDCTSLSQETGSQARNLPKDSIRAAFYVLKMLRGELKTQPRQWAANAGYVYMLYCLDHTNRRLRYEYRGNEFAVVRQHYCVMRRVEMEYRIVT